MDVKLVMFRENGDRREFPIIDQTIIGRREDCTIRIPLAEVSRKHVTITLEGSEVKAKDLGSANGTFLNNKPVTETTLKAGDHLVIGPVVFTVQIDGEPQDIRPVKTRLHRAAVTPGQARPKAKEPKVDSDFFGLDEDDPISALEALASSADQTAIDPYEEGEVSE
jgi:pSer/pThr/pTyr-binding forkhead associated (FHA) protein